MSMSDNVKAVLALTGKKQIELAQHFGMSKQTMSNKVARDGWSGYDLAKVAEFCGGHLAIVLPNGQQLILSVEKNVSPDE